MVTSEQLERFAKLFRGYDKAFGQYDTKKIAEAGKKNVGKPWTVPQKITEAAWRDHLDATGPGIGIVMLQANDTCRFGAIDIDDYKVDHSKLCRQIKKLELPLVVCRTKSGGAHLYVFFLEDIPAYTLRDRLGEWCAALGLSANTEQFPKQVSRANAQEIGNWINVPYQNAEMTMRYAFNPEDYKALQFEDFLTLAESARVEKTFMDKPFYRAHSEQDLFWEGPPCLISLHTQGGFAEGTRNEGMFGVGVYCRKRFGDVWESRMDEYNQAMAGLSSTEIAGLVKSLSKKEYTYNCKKAPLNSVCQRRTCLGREFGIGDAGTASVKVEILSVIRYDYPAPDPPMWSFEINGKQVMVDNDTFYSRDLLNKACMAQANCVPLHMPPARWLNQLNELVQSADTVPMPEDASPTGQLWARIEMFLRQGVNALTKEEVLTGKVWRKDGEAFFCSTDLFAYLDARRIKYKSTQEVWALLRKRGGDKRVWSFGKRGVNVWCVPTAEMEEDEPIKPMFGRMDEF